MTRPWRLGRREFLRSLGLAGALLLAPGIGAQRLPRTGFERSGDRAWTSEDDEAALLAALANRS
ncbi:MAG: carboxypeptidase, partial [Actinomycetota bacterium]|nr:carboxypeptidase [Actinomycetota bacterium]